MCAPKVRFFWLCFSWFLVYHPANIACLEHRIILLLILIFHIFLARFWRKSHINLKGTKIATFSFFRRTFLQQFFADFSKNPRLTGVRTIGGGCAGDLSIALFAIIFLSQFDQTVRKTECELANPVKVDFFLICSYF